MLLAADLPMQPAARFERRADGVAGTDASLSFAQTHCHAACQPLQRASSVRFLGMLLGRRAPDKRR